MTELEKLATFLHTISCDMPHAEELSELLGQRDRQKCYFYLEDTMEEGWNYPDHKGWLSLASKLCEEQKSTPVEVLRLLSQLLSLRRSLDILLDKYPNGANFARLVLFGPSSD